ncbi:MAG: HEPN domain-containing protein [Bacteroidales bacterium]|nr:HEPN domain-containing protein [Bacteroidales bacterium]
MNEKIEHKEKIVQHWIDSSEQNYSTMQNLIDSKDYSWALFMGHLVIEKLLKAIYVKNFQRHSVFTHDLLRLSNKIGLNMTDDQQEWLDRITTFNLNARYDNYKQDFYKLCTKEFTSEWIVKIEKLKQWLINQL